MSFFQNIFFAHTPSLSLDLPQPGRPSVQSIELLTHQWTGSEGHDEAHFFADCWNIVLLCWDSQCHLPSCLQQKRVGESPSSNQHPQSCVCWLLIPHTGPSTFLFVAVRCVSQDLFFMCSLRWCSCCSPPSICRQARTINALAISGQMAIQVSPLVCLCSRCLFRPSSLTSSSSSSVRVLFFAPQPGLAPIVPAEHAPREQHGPPLQK